MSSKCHLTTPAKAQEDTAQLDWSHGQVSKVNLSIKSPGIFFSTTVGDLGVIQDNELTLSENMRNVCHTCFYHLRQIRSVRRSLTTKAAYPDACIHLHKSRVLQRYLCGLNHIVHYSVVLCSKCCSSPDRRHTDVPTYVWLYWEGTALGAYATRH